MLKSMVAAAVGVAAATFVTLEPAAALPAAGDLPGMTLATPARMHSRHFAFGGGPRFHRGFHHRRFVFGGPVYYYGYHRGCAWLRHRALATGSRYWWRRYRACRHGY